MPLLPLACQEVVKRHFFLTGYSTCNVLYPICDRKIRMTSMYTAYREMKFIHLNNLMSENRSKAWVISRLLFSLDLIWILILVHVYMKHVTKYVFIFFLILPYKNDQMNDWWIGPIRSSFGIGPNMMICFVSMMYIHFLLNVVDFGCFFPQVVYSK